MTEEDKIEIIMYATFMIIEIIVAIIVFLLIKKNRVRKINEITTILLKLGNKTVIDNALSFIESYESDLEEIDSLKFKRKKFEVQRTALQKKIDNKSEEYKKAENTLSYFSKRHLQIYENYKDLVFRLFDERVAASNSKLEQQKQEELKKIVIDSEKRELLEEENDKKTLLSRSIEELNKMVNMLQVETSRTGLLEISYIQQVSSKLEIIESNKNAISSTEKKKMKRIYMLLSDILEKISNKDEIKVNIDIMFDILNEICN